MKPVSLLTMALGGPGDFETLKTRIDLCAGAGHTCEFRACALLPGCTPATSTVGFWSDRLGYMIYVHPTVAYTGGNPAAGSLFRAGRRGFPTFQGLADFLRSLVGTAPYAQPPAPGPRPSGVVPSRPTPVAPPTGAVPPYRPAPTTPSSGTAPTTWSPPTSAPPRTTTPPRPTTVTTVGSNPLPPAAIPTCEQLRAHLGAAVLGQEEAVERVSARLFAHGAKRQPARPLSLIFYGPTGVGKSELGKQVAPALNCGCGGAPYQFVWTELNTFTEAHSVYRLTGAPPGYVGYEDKPVLEAVVGNPRTVFMFDELEKAHPEVLKTFMSILDEGRCAARKEQPGRGRELDFRRCIFLFTTNADLSGAAGRPIGFAQAPPTAETEGRQGETAVDRVRRDFAADELARRRMAAGGCLREIAGRFGGFVEFHPLSEVAKRNITAKQITALAGEYGLELAHVSPELVDEIAALARSGGAFSVRSQVGVVEGLLTDYFARQAASAHQTATATSLRLEGTLEHLRLVPQGQTVWGSLLSRARGAG